MGREQHFVFFLAASYKINPNARAVFASTGVIPKRLLKTRFPSARNPLDSEKKI
jgi:hypothetical protein